MDSTKRFHPTWVDYEDFQFEDQIGIDILAKPGVFDPYFMNIHLSRTILLSLFLWSCQRESLPTNASKIIEAHETVSKHHRSIGTTTNVVKVVYFYARDNQPLPDWEGRLTRTLDDVSNYYKEQFSSFGVDIEGIPFEKNNGKYEFHLIRGDYASLNYNTNSGWKIQREISAKSERIDFRTDYVLIINALTYRKPEGTYVFHAPYYGEWGEVSANRGLCQVADSELLDPRNLESTKKMTFSERSIENKECSVAEFNSWYIGGIAHELGHMFGLRHDNGNPAELNKTSVSLMGESGSRHYREYLWKGKKNSVFSSAAVFQLVSHPVFAQSPKPSAKASTFNVPALSFSNNNGKVFLKSDMKTDASPYGAVVLYHPVPLSEYFNTSVFTLITTDHYEFELGSWKKGIYNVKLLLLFKNGIVRELNKAIEIDESGVVTERILKPGPVDVDMLYEKFKRSKKDTGIEKKIRILENILKPGDPVDPVRTTGQKMFLSDAKWVKASVGWDIVSRNYFTREAEHLFFLENQGMLYEKGLYAHAPSSFIFNLNRKWKTFSALVGLRDHANPQGSAIFKVIGDGKILYASPGMKVNQLKQVNVDISKVATLELRVDPPANNNFFSWGLWLNPKISR